MRSIDDPALIPALEALTVKSFPEVGQAVVDSLSKMPGQAATDSLTRHALLAPRPEVRAAAASVLRSRSLYSYVPTMIGSLSLPTDVQFDQFYLMSGQPVHRLAVVQHSMLADNAFVSTGGASGDIVISKRYGNSARFIPDPTMERDIEWAQREVAANAVKKAVNSRVTAALERATGNNLPADPQKWWDWWYDYNDVYRPPRQVYSHSQQALPRPFRIRFQSCFVAGTKVFTATGPMAIERIVPGDCVLAQDVETGELAYKPVLVTTVRPPSPVLAISVGGETIRATLGHPFWVSGVGWQMAKELKPGQRLHTPHGPLAIDSISEDTPAVCYNLVVAEFADYFVSDQKVLVHDNNLREGATATVPGLLAAK